MTFDATARPRPAISPMTETMTTAIIIRCILSRPFSTEYTVDNARESEEGDRGERCGNERYGQTLKEFRQQAVEESRLGIPLLFGMDVIHGYETVFPIPLGLSCTWDNNSIHEQAALSRSILSINSALL